MLSFQSVYAEFSQRSARLLVRLTLLVITESPVKIKLSAALGPANDKIASRQSIDKDANRCAEVGDVDGSILRYSKRCSRSEAVYQLEQKLLREKSEL